MDKELRIEQKHQQLSSMLTVLKSFMDPSKINSVLRQVNDKFPEMNFYSMPSVKESLGMTDIVTSKKQKSKAMKRNSTSQALAECLESDPSAWAALEFYVPSFPSLIALCI